MFLNIELLQVLMEYTRQRNYRVNKNLSKLLINHWKLYREVRTKLIQHFTPYSCWSALTTKALNMSLDFWGIIRKGYRRNAAKLYNVTER